MTYINKVGLCRDKYNAVYNSNDNSLAPKKESVSEVYVTDDLEHSGFKGFNNSGRSRNETKSWAENTGKLARKSLLFNYVGIPLKIFSYTLSHFDTTTIVAKITFTLERLAEAFGSKFRYDIHAQQGDNLDAETHSKERFGDRATEGIGKTNHFIQTKLRFLFPLLGLFDRDLGNDLDWLISDTAEASWLRNSTLNTGFNIGFAQDLFNAAKSKLKGEETNNSLESIWTHVKTSIQESYTKATELHKEYKSKPSDSTEKTDSLLRFSREMDKLTSVTGLVQIPINLFGDTMRPIARRLGLSGPVRNIIRVLSVADRGILGANYVFRFLIPTIQEERRSGEHGWFRASHMYMASLVGDVIDIPMTFFDQNIKDAPGLIKHGAEVFRILKNSSYNIFWSQKRLQNSRRVIKDLV